jgi:hypothetical protein
MRKKSAIEPIVTLCDGRIGDIHVPWDQDNVMGRTCPKVYIYDFIY